MPVEVLPLVQFLLVAGAILMVTLGLGLLFAGLYPAPYFASCRALVTRVIRPTMDSSWRAIPAQATSLVVKSYQAYVYYWFRQSENNFLVSGMFTVIVLLGIPAGAFFNVLRGGSPFLLILLASLALVFITLTILTETSRLRGLAGLLSILLFLVLFVFVPGYVFYSLTDRLLNLSVGRAFIGSFLVVPLLYLSAQSSVLAISQFFSGRGAGRLRQTKLYLNAFIAALPLAYLLTFGTFLVDQFTDAQKLVPTTWERLIAGVLVLSVGISLTVQTLTRGKRQNAVGVRDLVALFITVVPIAVTCIAVTTGDFHISTVQGLYWRETLDVRLVFWIFFLAFLPIILILLVNGILFFARMISCFFPKSNGVGNQNISRACVLIGSSSASVGVLASVLSAVI